MWRRLRKEIGVANRGPVRSADRSLFCCALQFFSMSERHDAVSASQLRRTLFSELHCDRAHIRQSRARLLSSRLLSSQNMQIFRHSILLLAFILASFPMFAQQTVSPPRNELGFFGVVTLANGSLKGVTSDRHFYLFGLSYNRLL